MNPQGTQSEFIDPQRLAEVPATQTTDLIHQGEVGEIQRIHPRIHQEILEEEGEMVEATE